MLIAGVGNVYTGVRGEQEMDKFVGAMTGKSMPQSPSGTLFVQPSLPAGTLRAARQQRSVAHAVTTV